MIPHWHQTVLGRDLVFLNLFRVIWSLFLLRID